MSYSIFNRRRLSSSAESCSSVVIGKHRKRQLLYHKFGGTLAAGPAYPLLRPIRFSRMAGFSAERGRSRECAILRGKFRIVSKLQGGQEPFPNRNENQPGTPSPVLLRRASPRNAFAGFR